MSYRLNSIKLPSGMKAKIIHYWPQIVGDNVAAMSNLISCNGDLITIGCCRTQAMELKYLNYKILESINQFLGHKRFIKIKILAIHDIDEQV